MKQLTYFLFALFLLANNILAKSSNILPIKDNKVIFQNIVNLEKSHSKEEIFNSAKSFLSDANLHRNIDLGFSTGFALFGVNIPPAMKIIESNERNRDTFVSENSPKTIRVNFFQYYQGKGAGALRTLFLNADLQVDIKDNKYRYTLDNFKWNHYNHFTGVQMPIWSTDQNCGMRGTLFELDAKCSKANRSRKKAIEMINEDVLLFISELEDHIQSELGKENLDEDW